MDMALFDLTSLEAREKFLDNFGSDIEITSYKMDLKLGEKLSNSCQIEILNKSEKSLTELTMALNANLSISEASLDENNIAYNRQGQAIILSDFNLQPGQRGTLLLDYQGTIKDIMNPGILLNYSSNTSSNLLPAMNWYPLIKTEQELPYELQVSYKKRLISNLNDFEVLDEGQSFLKGQTKYLYISDGFYRAKEIGGLEYVGSEEVIGHYLEDYDWTINSYLENYATNKNPKKIIIYPGAYSQALEIDENLMVSEF